MRAIELKVGRLDIFFIVPSVCVDWNYLRIEIAVVVFKLGFKLSIERRTK